MKKGFQQKKVLLGLMFFFGGLFISPLSFAADTYPKPVSDYVNDFAGVLNQVDSDAISKMFKELEDKTGIEAVAVTIESVKDYGTADKTIESFATNLFNEWGVGKKSVNNGVMILVAVKDRECRIELGQAYTPAHSALMKQVIDNQMTPYFASGDYSRGVFEGSRGILEHVTKKISWFQAYKWHLLIGALLVLCLFAGVSCMRSGKKGWGWAFFAMAGMLIFFLFKLLKSKGSDGFGGGRSSGGGASGKW